MIGRSIRLAAIGLCAAFWAALFGVAAHAGGPIPVPYNPRPYFYNFNQANTLPFRIGLQYMAQPISASYPSNTTFTMCELGDSTTAGAGTGIYNTATWAIAYRRNSWAWRLGDYIALQTGISVENQSSWGSAPTTGYDPRPALGSGWTATNQLSIAGDALYASSSTTTTTTWTFQSIDKAFDTIDIWYIQASGGGTFAAYVDGSGTASATVNTGSPATNGLVKATITGLSVANHTLGIQRTGTGGAINIVGVVPRLSTVRQVLNYNLGLGGTTAVTQATNTYVWSPANAIPAIGCQWTTIFLGINDYNTDSDSTFTASMQTIITKALSTTGSGAMLVIPHWVDTGTTSAAVQAHFASLLYALAATNNIPLIDYQNLYQSRANQAAWGYDYDTLHNNAQDAQNKAQLTYEALAYSW